MLLFCSSQPHRPPLPPATPAPAKRRRVAEDAVGRKPVAQGTTKERGPAGKRNAKGELATGKATRPRHKLRESSETPRPRQVGMGLHTVEGLRKYLTAGEREAFLREAEHADRSVRTLCMTLAYAGCRLSEALALTVDRVDLAAGVLTFESLKKRRDGVYRSVPVPPPLLDALDMVHGVRELQAARGRGRGVRLWPWSRMTGWRAVHDVMAAAQLEGPHA